jgi:hypothetical protein
VLAANSVSAPVSAPAPAQGEYRKVNFFEARLDMNEDEREKEGL